MRQCGGRVREHVLTENRVAWTCGDCGRYEVISLKGALTKERDDSKHDPVGVCHSAGIGGDA
jgi:hypothetical protein